MKPGWKTTEFWQTLIAQALAALVLLGVVTVNDSQTLEEALGKSVAAIFALLLNGNIVGRYVAARLHLKSGRGEEPARPSGDGASEVLPLFLAALALGLLAGAVSAEPPATPALVGQLSKLSVSESRTGWKPIPRTYAVLPWRAKVERELQELRNRPQQPPQVPPPIYIVPPLQQLPIQGDPRQLLPIPGNPYQQLPIPGSPYQQLPIPGNPQQPLPIYKQLPAPGQPKQPLPNMPPAGAGPQSYTIIRALCLPIP